jgi:hypothetical protein
MSYRTKWQNFRHRDWSNIRDAWLADVPSFTSLGARPDPGLENLPSLLSIDLPGTKPPYKRYADVEGLRRNALWEAVFLFHKCSHTNLAAQRLGQQGMHSWCMFNSYHSAYLGAKGLMALLGIAWPRVRGEQVAVDLFLQAESKTQQKKLKALGSRQFQEFLVLRLHVRTLDQRYLWEAFQRILQMAKVDCWDQNLVKELLDVSYQSFSPPRNNFLYRAQFWPLEDLMSDASVEEMEQLVGTELDIEHEGFLLRLGFSVYRLFEQLIGDLGKQSPIIQMQVSASRSLAESTEAEFGRYRLFVSQLAA